jgi:hypothetical protein
LAWVSADLIKPAKLWLRISSDKLDDELTQTIEACKLDLSNSGVRKLDTSDALIKQAVKLYCKAQFGYDGGSDEFSKAYEHLKAALSLSGDYNAEEG